MAKQIWIPKPQIVALPGTIDALQAAMLKPLEWRSTRPISYVRLASGQRSHGHAFANIENGCVEELIPGEPAESLVRKAKPVDGAGDRQSAKRSPVQGPLSSCWVRDKCRASPIGPLVRSR